ncbi:Eukaryotic translation initiation factor 5A [Ascosphaera pollenicola]|nr:Eukaryotic translation initiation factor 5A [Ascosphaera pollenicola]
MGERALNDFIKLDKINKSTREKWKKGGEMYKKKFGLVAAKRTREKFKKAAGDDLCLAVRFEEGCAIGASEWKKLEALFNKHEKDLEKLWNNLRVARWVRKNTPKKVNKGGEIRPTDIRWLLGELNAARKSFALPDEQTVAASKYHLDAEGLFYMDGETPRFEKNWFGKWLQKHQGENPQQATPKQIASNPLRVQFGETSSFGGDLVIPYGYTVLHVRNY